MGRKRAEARNHRDFQAADPYNLGEKSILQICLLELLGARLTPIAEGASVVVSSRSDDHTRAGATHR